MTLRHLVGRSAFVAFCLSLLVGYTKDGNGEYVWTFKDGWPAGYTASGIPLNHTNVNEDADPDNDLDNDYFQRIYESYRQRNRSSDELGTDAQSNIYLGDCGDEGCEISFTFIFEGAGNMNAIGYFTFDPDNPPSDPTQLTTEVIFLPNASKNDGRAETNPGIERGDTINLGRFPSNSAVGFVLLGDGFNSSTGADTISGGGQPYADKLEYWEIFYTLEALNHEYQSEAHRHLAPHTLVYYDHEYDLLTMGMEDVSRRWGADNDFNDVLWVVEVTPNSGIDPDNYKPLPGSIPCEEIDPNTGHTGLADCDTDGDGANDAEDEFPVDPKRAFSSLKVPYTLAFEDRWPLEADYDMNDMVVDEWVRVITNANSEVTDLIVAQQYDARGATLHFGHGLMLDDVAAANLESAFYTELGQDGLTNAEDFNPLSIAPGSFAEIAGVESLSSEAGVTDVSLRLHNDLFDVLPAANSDPSDDCHFYNTVEVACAVQERKMYALALTFTNAVATSDIVAQMNPFIFASAKRSREIHMADRKPTELADTSEFGTADDTTIPAEGRYYRNDRNLPWAVKLLWDTPANFAYADFLDRMVDATNGTAYNYPDEYEAIDGVFPLFDDWVLSNGESFQNWNTLPNANRATVFTGFLQ